MNLKLTGKQILKVTSSICALLLCSGMKTFIIGGEELFDGDPIAKSTVGLYNTKEQRFVCTGSLITDRIVLTAAHCLPNTDHELRHNLGIFFSRRMPANVLDFYTLNPRYILAARTPEAWKSRANNQVTDWGDIAVLLLNETAPEPFTPATLLKSPSLLHSGRAVELAGFGMISSSDPKSAKTLRKAYSSISSSRFSKTEISVRQFKGVGVCRGDSGGPLFIRVGDRYFLAGVTSRGMARGVEGEKLCQGISIFTSLVAHKSFIETTILDFQSR